MNAVLVVCLFLVASVSVSGFYIFGDQYFVTSTGQQLSCAKGAKSPGIGHDSFSVIYSKDNGMYTCDMVALTDAAYRPSAKYPNAPANAKQSNSFVIGTFDLNKLWLCRQMVSGDEARLETDNRLVSFSDPRTNSGYICYPETA